MDLREQILDASRQVLLRSGYERLSMRRIAKRIGVSATSIYIYFENKDALFQALVDDGMQRLYEELVTAQKRAEDPLSKLEHLCHAYIDFALRNPEYYEIMFVLRPRDLRRFPSESFRRARRSLELLINLAEEVGEPSRQEALLIATATWTQLHGAASLLNAQRVDARIDRALLVERVVKAALRDFRIATTSLAIPVGSGAEMPR